VVEHLGGDEEEEEGAVLVVDETGFLKEAWRSSGRQAPVHGHCGQERFHVDKHREVKGRVKERF
jgi:hypothetical protein